MTETNPTIVTNKYELLDYIDVNGAKKQDWVAKLEPYKNLINPEIAISFLLDECRRNKDILSCTPQSVLNCLIQASQLGFKISSAFGHAYAIPFNKNDKKTNTTIKELTLCIGYKGLIALIYRLPNVAKINTRIVYQNEIDNGKFSIQYGKDEFLHHVPSFSKEGGPALYYADVTFKDGTYKFYVMSHGEGLEARENSKGWLKNPKEPWEIKKNNESLWGKHFDQMVLGKCIRKLFTTIPGLDNLNTAIPLDPLENSYDSETGEVNKTAANSTNALVDSLSEFSSEILDLEAKNVGA